VVFTFDGNALLIDPSPLAADVQDPIATVTFQRGSTRKTKILRLAFQRCPRALRAPRFTG
jgi:hypothetical protein